jgi:hypothetical protein
MAPLPEQYTRVLPVEIESAALVPPLSSTRSKPVISLPVQNNEDEVQWLEKKQVHSWKEHQYRERQPGVMGCVSCTARKAKIKATLEHSTHTLVFGECSHTCHDQACHDGGSISNSMSQS